MTTTNMYQGIDDGSRSSSKVLKPPGGGSSNIFGDPEPRGQPAQRQQQATNVLGQPLDQPGANQGAPEPRDYSQQTQNPSQLPAAGFSAGTKAPEQVRAQSKKPQDSFNNIFGDNSPGQGGQQRNRRKGDISSAEEQMERNLMAFNDHGVPHDDKVWALQANLQEQRKALLATNRNHAKAPVSDTYSNLFGEENGNAENGLNRRRLANTVSEYNIITGILNTPQMLDHNSPQITNCIPASRNQRNRGAFNPITGEDYEQSPQSTQQRNASRVLNPPGGKSSGLW